ncbi:MAG: prepilin-type N-terminal cleavage/methylation domain-containing protein [Candidatus Omnitrophica bacterium]|nr:prepilin-type N-terminal cleavage/methylation domain-containing protein [Candidatus Omnitrophota bacterium]
MMWPIGSSKGLTLVEILVSVAILAGGTVLVLQALARGAQALSIARNRSVVYAFSAAKMADLELAAHEGGASQREGSFTQGRERFRWRVEHAPVEASPLLERLSLTVAWRQGARDYAVDTSTLVPRPTAQP